MKKLLLIAAIAFSMSIQAQIKMPAPSPTQTIIQDFGLGRLELTYSRPSIKGRQLFKENSELAPLGKVWRTGANAVTKLKVTDAIAIGGKSLDTGSYAIYTIPGKTEWTIIINKDATKWGTEYVEADDVFRITIAADKMKESVETFTFQFANIKAESCELHLMWGTTAVIIPITTNVKDRIRASVEKALSGDNVSTNVYQAAANFYFELDKDYTKALTNASKASASNPKAFWLFLLKAKVEKELGNKVDAKADAEKCISLATEAKNEDYVRMAKELIAKL
jgi:hypothetical protein